MVVFRGANVRRPRCTGDGRSSSTAAVWTLLVGPWDHLENHRRSTMLCSVYANHSSSPLSQWRTQKAARAAGPQIHSTKFFLNVFKAYENLSSCVITKKNPKNLSTFLFKQEAVPMQTDCATRYVGQTLYNKFTANRSNSVRGLQLTDL